MLQLRHQLDQRLTFAVGVLERFAEHGDVLGIFLGRDRESVPWLFRALGLAVTPCAVDQLVLEKSVPLPV